MGHIGPYADFTFTFNRFSVNYLKSESSSNSMVSYNVRNNLLGQGGAGGGSAMTFKLGDMREMYDFALLKW